MSEAARRNLHGKEILLLVGSVLVLAVALIVGFFTGRFYAEYHQSGAQQASSVSGVCGSSVIDQFNGAVAQYNSNPASLKGLAMNITARSGYEQDATCVNIEFFYYMMQQNTQGMTKYYTLAKQLNEGGYYPSNKLSQIISLQEMSSAIKYSKPGSPSKTAAGGIG